VVDACGRQDDSLRTKRKILDYQRPSTSQEKLVRLRNVQEAVIASLPGAGSSFATQPTEKGPSFQRDRGRLCWSLVLRDPKKQDTDEDYMAEDGSQSHCRLTGHFCHSTEFERNPRTSENGETPSRDVA